MSITVQAHVGRYSHHSLRLTCIAACWQRTLSSRRHVGMWPCCREQQGARRLGSYHGDENEGTRTVHLSVLFSQETHFDRRLSKGPGWVGYNRASIALFPFAFQPPCFTSFQQSTSSAHPYPGLVMELVVRARRDWPQTVLRPRPSSLSRSLSCVLLHPHARWTRRMIGTDNPV